MTQLLWLLGRLGQRHSGEGGALGWWVKLTEVGEKKDSSIQPPTKVQHPHHAVCALLTQMQVAGGKTCNRAC
jgi:hypothetical protein